VGDRREEIFRDDEDRPRFLGTRREACAKTGWRVHALCLLPHHFPLMLGTPQPNWVAGMKWLLGTYTARFHRRHKVFGHLFSGRSKALVVEGSGRGYLRTVCDYVHLNPARARLLEPEPALRTDRWSSWPEKLKRPGQRRGGGGWRRRWRNGAAQRRARLTSRCGAGGFSGRTS
jgi:REP element-mobilizing transposase RayT